MKTARGGGIFGGVWGRCVSQSVETARQRRAGTRTAKVLVHDRRCSGAKRWQGAGFVWQWWSVLCVCMCDVCVKSRQRRAGTRAAKVQVHLIESLPLGVCDSADTTTRSGLCAPSPPPSSGPANVRPPPRPLALFARLVLNFTPRGSHAPGGPARANPALRSPAARSSSSNRQCLGWSHPCMPARCIRRACRRRSRSNASKVARWW